MRPSGASQIVRAPLQQGASHLVPNYATSTGHPTDSGRRMTPDGLGIEVTEDIQTALNVVLEPLTGDEEPIEAATFKTLADVGAKRQLVRLSDGPVTEQELDEAAREVIGNLSMLELRVRAEYEYEYQRRGWKSRVRKLGRRYRNEIGWLSRHS